MAKDNIPVTYSAADIEKYWTGQLPATEQHAMEKAALEDPFLADAMEGYEKRSQISQGVSADSNDLKAKLAARIDEKKKGAVIPFTWWKVAAVIVVVAGAGWLYTSISSKSKESDVNKQTVVKNEVPAPVRTTDIPATETDSSAIPPLRDVAVNKSRKQPSQPGAVIPAEKIDESIAAAPAASESKTADDRKEEAANLFQADSFSKQEEVVAKTAPLKKDIPGINDAARERRVQGIMTENDTYKKSDKALAGRARDFSNTFNGNLTDQSNKPVANAFIQIPQLNVATQTDNNGYFSFKAQDTSLAVSVESQGFMTQNMQLRNKATLNQIVLKPAVPNQAEIVTQSNGAEKMKRPAVQEITITIPDAEPEVGWDAYKEYLEKNKKLTKEQQEIHGTVLISFNVHKKWIGNYSIEQSLDDELDAEAIRLIKHGPAWKLLKGKKAKATVIVRF